MAMIAKIKKARISWFWQQVMSQRIAWIAANDWQC
jgi:hypothetical protein